KACSLLPSSDPAELEQVLALARRAVELGAGSGLLPYFQMAQGIAEYRSGHFPEAEAVLGKAISGGSFSAHVANTSTFYKAMSLHRQGKNEEARTIALGTVAKMKPLPKDAEIPLAGSTSADDLIMWLAYKEANALIKFNANSTKDEK